MWMVVVIYARTVGFNPHPAIARGVSLSFDYTARVGQWFSQPALFWLNASLDAVLLNLIVHDALGCIKQAGCLGLIPA